MELATGERSVIVSAIASAEAVETARVAGIGNDVMVSIGGVNDPVNGSPFIFAGTVYSLFEDDPVGGDIAVIRSGGVHVVIPSRRKPYHQIREFEKLGLDVQEHDITVGKWGYLEPELRAAASAALQALTPGAVNQDIASLPFERVQRPVFPLDPEMPEPTWQVTMYPPIG